MKISYYLLLLLFVFGFAVQCSAQSVIVKGHIANTSGAPLQVVVENNSTGALLLASCDENGNYSIDFSSLGATDSIFCSYNNCNGMEVDILLPVYNGDSVYIWNSDYCPNYAGANAIIEGQISGAGRLSIPILITASDSVIAQGSTDSSGSYSITISPAFSVADIKCSFINCNNVTTDTPLFANHNILTWNANYCPAAKKPSVTLRGHLSNTNGVRVPITIQLKDSIAVIDTLQTQTDTDGNYSVTISYNFIKDSVKCVFLNCNKQLIDTAFILLDTSNTWNKTFCPATTPCPISFTSSYCPCTNTFYLQLDTSNIPYTYWSVQWSFGEGSTSTALFPTKTFSSRSLYNVCVSLFDSTLLSPVCDFCHSLGFDSTGNLVTRVEEDGGFNLQVIPAGTLQQYLNTPLNTFSLYPNPVSSDAGVMIYSDEATGYTVTVTNVIGQQVISLVQNVPAGSSNFNVDVHTLAPGAYFMTIRFEYGQQVTNMFLKN